MSLMLKLLATTLLVSSFAYAQDTSKKIADFLSDEFSENPRLNSVDVEVSDVVPLKDLKSWNAYVIDVKATLKDKPKETISQRMIWFSNGEIITKELTKMSSGESLTDLVKPDMKPAFYAKSNLIYGNENAKHKVAIFSDPLCPFCRGYVPGAIKEMKEQPDKFAVYYYHFPLPRLHPAAVLLVQAAAAAEHKGFKDVVLKLYSVEINPKETNVDKILTAFNKAVGSNITVADIKNPEVQKMIQFDQNVAATVMVAGTPTVYFDDKIDQTKKKYKSVK
ncbi:MAG: thioredoxin domain-containing protein [Campylobacterales bacterium]|nr:thioredoxin domain-containing protein [Campylobacterales bacterium]